MAPGEGNRKPVRVFLDGCFDILHYGHANSMRQAKAMGDILIIGVHSTADILANKGPSVFTEEERYQMVRGIKWVDEVVEGSPYWPAVDTLTKNNCDFATHGDDLPVAANGEDPLDVYWKAKKLKIFKRTQGVSTTDIVGRLLKVTDTAALDTPGLISLNSAPPSAFKSPSDFLATSQKFAQFTSCRELTDSDKVVYTSGDFDLFRKKLSFVKVPTLN